MNKILNTFSGLTETEPEPETEARKLLEATGWEERQSISTDKK